jgi:hypothetical protein
MVFMVSGNMKKILFIICGLNCLNVFALNVTPLCTDVSSTNKSRIINKNSEYFSDFDE